jgi:uncharacterized protein
VAANERTLDAELMAGGEDIAPERLCAVTREILETDELIRFVAAPDGQIVPDLERRLPGRGVWIKCHRETVEKAVNSKIFAKSLKQPAVADPELGSRIDGLLLRRLTSALALANKAGLVLAGFQQVESGLEKAEVRVLLHGSDAAPDGCLKLDRKFKAIQRDLVMAAPIVAILTITEMSLAIGRPNVVHAGLISGGLSERFLREAERLARYRASPAVSGQLFSFSANEG